jgi:hypothetical protein
VHKNLPSLDSYPDDFGKRGYMCARGDYTRDEDSWLGLIQMWEHEKENFVTETERRNTAEVLSPDENNASLAVLNDDARVAADWLTKAINKHDYASAKFMKVKLHRISCGENYSWRAWCNWRRAKDETQMDKAKRLKLLDMVVYDCGFVAGNLNEIIVNNFSFLIITPIQCYIKNKKKEKSLF